MKKKLLSILTLLLTVCSGAWAVDETIFLWNYDGSSTYGDGSTNGTFDVTNTSGVGTIKFVTYEKKKSEPWGTSGYDASVTDNDLKPSITRVAKLGNNGAHYRITPASGNFKPGDIVYICGGLPAMISVSADPTSTNKIAGSDATIIASSITLGSSIGACKVGSFTLPEGFSETNEIYISRVQSGATMGIAAIKVVRPGTPSDATFSPATGSAVSGGDDVTITANGASAIYYKWTDTESEPDTWNNATATSSAISVSVPNESGTRYLYAKGWNLASGYGNVTHATYTVSSDVTPPSYSGASIADNATNVSLSGDIVLTFDENVVCSTNATLTPTSGGDAINLTPVVDGTTITYSYTYLDTSKEYTFSLAANSVADNAGNKYASAISFEFTTKSTITIGRTVEFSTTPTAYTVSGYNHVTVAIANGTQQTATGKDVSYKSNTVKMAVPCYMNKGTGDYITAYNSSIYAGASIVVDAGYKFIPTTVTARVAEGYTTTQYRVVLTDGTNELYKSADQSITSSTVGVDFSATLSDIELTGTTYLNLYYWTVGATGNKYTVPLELTLTGTLVECATMTITSATWASFSNASEVAIPDGVTAYYASASDGSTSVTLKEINGGYIPANTGVVINGTEGTYYATKTATSASLGGTNYLYPWLTEGEPNPGGTYYTLGVSGTTPVFMQSTGGTLAAGKSYLYVAGPGAPQLSIDIDGISTGINTVQGAGLKVDGEYYNLNGQRVAQPTKGLYIVNGKKVIVK